MILTDGYFRSPARRQFPVWPAELHPVLPFVAAGLLIDRIDVHVHLQSHPNGKGAEGTASRRTSSSGLTDDRLTEQGQNVLRDRALAWATMAMPGLLEDLEAGQVGRFGR